MIGISSAIIMDFPISDVYTGPILGFKLVKPLDVVYLFLKAINTSLKTLALNIEFN